MGAHRGHRALRHRRLTISRVAKAAFACLLALSTTARASDLPDAATAGGWLDALYDRAAADLAAGKPMVAEVHVALCDNSIIHCGGNGMGDGASLERNLYWGTTHGMHGWLSRRASGWRLVGKPAPRRGEVLATEIWHRRADPDGALRKRGVTKPFDVYLIAEAWRGSDIDPALESWLDDLYGDATRTYALDDGRAIDGGAAAHLVAWVAHNRFMDLPTYDFQPRAAKAGARPRGVVAIACYSQLYLASQTSSPARVPLFFTADFVFASAPALVAAIGAFAAGGSLEAIRKAGITGYAIGQDKPYGRVQNAFTNPARWRYFKRRCRNCAE